MLGQLAPLTDEIEVKVDGKARRFRLRALPVKKQLDFLFAQAIGKANAEEYITRAIDRQDPDPVLAVHAAFAVLLSQQQPVVEILCTPADEGEPLSEADFWDLEPGDSDRVLVAQEGLTRMDQVMGNGATLLDKVRAERSIKSRQGGSESRPTSLEPA